MTTATFIDRLLEPVTELLPTETAQKLVDLKIDEQMPAEIDTLAKKANAGSLTESERSDYEEIVEGLDLIAILKSKARAALRRRAL